MSEDLLGLSEWDGLDDEFLVVERADLRKSSTEDELRLRVEQYVQARKYAYIRVFAEGNSTPDDRAIVMDDLANFCRKRRSTGDANTHIAARLDGRREVILRIDEYLELSIAELVERKTE